MGIELENLTTGKSILFSDSNGYILQDVDFGQVIGIHNTTQHINLVGSKVNSTSLGVRDVSIRGVVCGDSGSVVSKNKTVLNRLINPNDNLKINNGNYSLIIRPDSSIKYGVGYRENNQYFCKFLIQGTAFDPTFKRVMEEVFYYSSVGRIPLFPLVMPIDKGMCFGKISSVSTKNVPNDGDVEAGFTIKFIAEEGEVTNPKITNNKTGKFIEIIINMQKGDIVEVSTVTGNKYAKFIRGNTQTDIFKLVSKKSTMSMTLNTGVNDIAITAARNASNLNNVIKFKPLYLEVQE